MALDIQIGKEGAQISIKKDGIQQCKNVDFGELMAVLQSHAVHDFGLLPANTRFLAVSGNNYTIAVELPPGQRNLVVEAAEGKKAYTIEKVPVPAALFVFQLVMRDGGFFHNTSYAFALEGERLLFSTDKLYAYPLPNIHSEDNRICWGKNDMKIKLKSLSGVEGLVRTYFTAPFNHDLFDTQKLSKDFPWQKVNGSRGAYDVARYFNYLVENGFHKEWLRPLSPEIDDFAKTIKQIGR